MGVVVIAAQDDLVIDAVDVEQIALDVGIKARERHAGADAAAAIDTAPRLAGQVLRVFRQIDVTYGTTLKSPSAKGRLRSCMMSKRPVCRVWSVGKYGERNDRRGPQAGHSRRWRGRCR